MKTFEKHLEAKFRELNEAPFFARLAADESPTKTLQILPYTLFWFLAFQDIISLNAEKFEDEELKALAYSHVAEESGHNVWFFEDFKLIYRDMPSVLDLFDKEHLYARQVSYSLMSEVYRAESDHERIAFTMAMEEASKVYFTALVAHYERAGLADQLKALGHLHLEAEMGHELYGDEMGDAFSAIELSPESRKRAMVMADRVYASFLNLADVLEDVLANSSPEKEEPIRLRLEEMGIPIDNSR